MENQTWTFVAFAYLSWCHVLFCVKFLYIYINMLKRRFFVCLFSTSLSKKRIICYVSENATIHEWIPPGIDEISNASWAVVSPLPKQRNCRFKNMASVICVWYSSCDSSPIQTFLVLTCHISSYLGGNIINDNYISALMSSFLASCAFQW